MLFNSINFAIFLPIVFLLYWLFFQKNLKFQNILLLVSSYFFYACWDWRFLFLLIFSTLLDYFTGIKMEESKTENLKKIWFWISISINLGFLGVFKYYNFFASSFANAVSNFGLEVNLFTLKVILPVGISFYTFHGLSYVIDIYKNRIKAEKAEATSTSNSTVKAASSTSVNADAKTNANASSTGETSANDGTVRSSGSTIISGDANANVSAKENMSGEAKATAESTKEKSKSVANEAKAEGSAKVKTAANAAGESSNSTKNKANITAEAKSQSNVKAGANH